MIHSVCVKNFKKFQRLKFELQQHAVIADQNNSGKTTLLQAIATWAELGEIWVERNADLARDDSTGAFHRVKFDIADFKALALSSFDDLWHNQDTRQPISIQVATDRWDGSKAISRNFVTQSGYKSHSPWCRFPPVFERYVRPRLLTLYIFLLRYLCRH